MMMIITPPTFSLRKNYNALIVYCLIIIIVPVTILQLVDGFPLLRIVPPYSSPSATKRRRRINNNKFKQQEKQRQYGGNNLPRYCCSLSSSSSSSSSSSCCNDVVAKSNYVHYSREEGQQIIDSKVFPKQDYSKRIGWGRDAIFGCSNDDDDSTTNTNKGALSPNDPRLSMTYAEFPLRSFDQLLDIALKYYNNNMKKQQQQHNNDDDDDEKADEEKDEEADELLQDNNNNITFIDIGSGCGRIVFYLGLTAQSSSSSSSWKIHGIEISTLLHDIAKQTLNNKCINELNLFTSSSSEEEESTSSTTIKTTEEEEEEEDTITTTTQTKIELHCGPADEYSTLLKEADIIFAYSTAFQATTFSPDLSAMILNQEWNELLSSKCKKGCIAITTDRALDPQYGWKLIDRLDVDNPEVVGSTGFIHILE